MIIMTMMITVVLSHWPNLSHPSSQRYMKIRDSETEIKETRVYRNNIIRTSLIKINTYKYKEEKMRAQQLTVHTRKTLQYGGEGGVGEWVGKNTFEVGAVTHQTVLLPGGQRLQLSSTNARLVSFRKDIGLELANLGGYGQERIVLYGLPFAHHN